LIVLDKRYPRALIREFKKRLYSRIDVAVDLVVTSRDRWERLHATPGSIHYEAYVEGAAIG